MTEQEFTELMDSYGFVVEDNCSRYLSVNIPNRYNKPMRYIFYYKEPRRLYPEGELPAGGVEVYPISPVMSIDGYVLDYEVAGYGCEKKFSKVHKLKRFLDEQMADLREWKTKILETELSWDFCNDDE